MSSNNIPINQLILPTNYTGSGSAQEAQALYNQVMNQPIAQFVPKVSTPVQQQAPSINADERFNAIMYNNATGSRPLSEMEQRVDGNVPRNVAREARELATGLNYIWSHASELIGEGVNNIAEFYKNTDGPLEAYLKSIRQVQKLPEGIVNFLGADYNFNTADMGTKSGREILANIIEGAVENPINTTLDFISLGGLGALGRLAKKVPVLGRVAKGAEVEKRIAGEAVAGAQDINKLEDTLNNVNKIAKENNVDLAKVIEGAETGTTLNANEKVVLKELRKFSDEYESFANKYSPEPLVGGEETAIVQKILRDRLKTNPAMTYEQVRREVVPILESGENIKQLAKEGNTVAKEVAGAKALYDKGRIFPVTHALANVDRTTATIEAIKGGTDTAERAGRFSNRLWGTSSYEDISKQLRNPDAFLRDLSDKYVNKTMSTAILDGAFNNATKDIMGRTRYIDRGLLEQGKLQDALDSMRKQRLLDTDIVLDADTASELSKQLSSQGSAYSKATEALYRLGKQAMLAQGTYLGANAITGATNALMNSGAMIVNDVVDAIRSQGRLTRELGVRKRGGQPNFGSTPITKHINKFNYYTGGAVFGWADRAMQNKFAEIATHARLRKQGVPFDKRMEALHNMDKMELGEFITDIKRASLINSKNTGALPKSVAETMSAINPFWRWSVTATQSTINMLEKNPLMANVVLTDILANIGFDREMQNRLNLGVTLDKPYVSFKMDKNGNMRQMSAEFVPITTSIKTFDFAEGGFGNTVPIIGTIYNASKGLDRYGKPMKRALGPNGEITQTIGTKRYQYDPSTGEMKELGFQGDEVLSTAVKTLIGLPNTYNRTLGPIASGLFGEGGKFYQPYDQSILGSYTRYERNNNLIFGGNALRGRSGQDVMNILKGVYESPYFESEDRISPYIQRKFFRGYNRDAQRRMFEE